MQKIQKIKQNKTNTAKNNYAYGRQKEKQIGRVVCEMIGGTSFRRSKGSRGPSDVTVYYDGRRAYDIQCKASRAKSKHVNMPSYQEIINLINYSKRRGTTPLIAITHGKKYSLVHPYVENYELKLSLRHESFLN